jgi:hypothetical protein
MNVRDLDGNISYWNIIGHITNNIQHKSKYHLIAKDMLKAIYPTMQILEEVPIYPSRSKVMYLDFYIPMLKKAIEIQGEQHYKFVAHYHTNKLAFLKAQKRDRDKKEWCETNGIKYIELAYDKQNEWEATVANN